MATVGFHASHEQAPPSALLAAVQQAEAAGFDSAVCSDHLAPWSVRQGHSGHAWTWLGAALTTTSLPFGVVTAPGQRYHPVMTAPVHVRPDDVRGSVVVSSDPGEITATLRGIVDLGVDELALHHVGQQQERFIDTLVDKVLPELWS